MGGLIAPIETSRLHLVAGTVDLLTAELAGRAALARALAADVSEEWPPQFYDNEAVRYSLRQLEAEPALGGWGLYYFLWRASGDELPIAVGAGGFTGAPKDGAVELGYSIVPAHQRRGFASEAVRGMSAYAFADPKVERVLAHTLPELVASIGVLEKCGFTPTGPGEEAGTIGFALDRETWKASTAR